MRCPPAHLNVVVPIPRFTISYTASVRAFLCWSGGARKLAAHLGGDPGAVGSTGHLGGEGLHNLSHPRHAGRSGLGDGRGHHASEFLVGQLLRQVAGEHVALRALGRRLVGAPGRLERVGGFPPLLRLAGQYPHDLVIGKLPRGVAGYLLIRDRGEHHPQRAEPHLITCAHRGVEVGTEPFLEFVHDLYPARPGPGTDSASVLTWHHRWVRARTLTSIAVAAGAAAVGYASVIERNWFALRRQDVPVLPPGSDPLRVLHISDLHLTPGRHRLMAFVRSLAGLEPDLVVNTGDSIAAPDAIDPLLDSLGPLLDRPGVFVYGSNDLYSPKPGNPARYLWRTSAGEHERDEPDLPWEKLGVEFTAKGWLDLNNRRGQLTVNGLDLAFAGVHDSHTVRDRYDL